MKKKIQPVRKYLRAKLSARAKVSLCKSDPSCNFLLSCSLVPSCKFDRYPEFRVIRFSSNSLVLYNQLNALNLSINIKHFKVKLYFLDQNECLTIIYLHLIVFSNQNFKQLDKKFPFENRLFQCVILKTIN